MPRTTASLMKQWRTIANINTTEAGRLLRLSKRTIEDIEQGRRRADDEVTRLALERLIKKAKEDG